VIIWIVAAFVLLVLLNAFKVISAGERARVVRMGRVLEKPVGPGLVCVLPFVDRLERVSIDPLSVSLPPQSAITKDEIPIQLQASLDARISDARLALTAVRDWKIYLMSQLQDAMKEKLEDLDFDSLPTVFPSWVESIRQVMDEKAEAIGVEITGLQISNLSPRTKPQ
jgi:regulator of protease activity HflC (stomatin/prohibitin superfamily)